MNRILRKITATLLSVTMVLSGMGVFPRAMSDLYSYADSDSGSDSTPQVDRSGGAYKTQNADKSTKPHMNTSTWYMLECITGSRSGSDAAKSIIITYIDSNSRRHRQILYPNKKEYLDKYTTTIAEGNAAGDKNGCLLYNKSDWRIDYLQMFARVTDSNNVDMQNFVPYTGSRMVTYSTMVQIGPSQDNVSNQVIRRYEGEHIIRKDKVGSEFKSVYDTVKGAPFAANSVERLLFKMEYDLGTIESVAFYCEGVGQSSWDLKEWAIYTVESYYSVKTLTGANDPAKQFPKVKIQTGTFITDKLWLDADLALICRSDAASLEEGFNFENSGMFTFYNKNSLPTYHGVKCEYSFSQYNGSRKQASSDAILNFSINLMDSYGAGIETYNKLPGGNFYPLKETMTAKIDYIDERGFKRDISLPVVSNAILEYFTMSDGSWEGAQEKIGELLSYAQQGESMVFSVALPYFSWSESSANKSELLSISLNYDNTDDEDDIIIIKDITVYDNNKYTGGVYKEYFDYNDLKSSGHDVNKKGTLNPLTINLSVKEGIPAIYHTKAVAGGTFMQTKDPSSKFTFIKGPAEPEVQKDYSTTYLVTINTSDVNFADTTDDVYVSFNYAGKDGTPLQTLEYSLQEVCREFYGYNPGLKGGQVVDGSYGNYCYCMRPGGSLKFFIDIRNLDHFTGMTAHLAEGGKDDWQMDSVQISAVQNVGRRTVMTPPEGRYGEVRINRLYDREVTAVPVYESSTKVYIQPGVTETVNLEEGTYSTETERRDMSEYYYEMNYEIATSELHFDETAWKYQVIVNVQKNSVEGTSTDDCGSDNLYYFQLVFEKGTSGYVLANQQLNHDGFRSGQAEAFNITINEDLGELVAVNIIPDDVTGDSQKLDKLCISSIEVIKSNPDTANKRYVCDNVGWISNAYIDNGEKSGRDGRNAADLVNTIPVDYSGYVLAVEFSIATDSYKNEDGQQSSEQYIGGMKCNIVYRTSSGQRRSTGDLDMVSLMYDYAGRKGSSDATYGTVSDPDYMFRENHINRFIVDNINEAATIESITLSGKPQYNCQLPIGGISMKLLKSDGALIINSEGDFQRIYNKEPALLTEEIPGRTLPHKFSFPAGIYTSYTFAFGENEIPELDSAESINSVISREPVSSNDTLNLYVYMKEGTRSPDDEKNKYNLKASISYSSVSTSNTYVNECSKMSHRMENGRVVFYAQGLSANNISVLTNVKLSALDALGDRDIRVDYAIVQQVRNGVAINTYKIKFFNEIIPLQGSVSMASKSPASHLGFTQSVALHLGEGTQTAKLVPEEYDIAMAIEYTSTASDDATVFTSPYIFASDSGVSSIHKGSVIDFTFTEAYIKEITGIKLIAMNGLDVVVDSGNVVCKSGDDTGNVVTDDWFSMGEIIKLGPSAVELPITSKRADDVNALKRAKFTFTTMSQSSVIDSGGTAPIRMVVAYRSNVGTNEQYVLEDMREWASGGFTAGENATVEFFLPGASSLSYVQLVPYDQFPSNSASWNLQNVKFKLDGGDDSSEHSLPVNRTLYERNDTLTVDGNVDNYINVSTMKVGLNRTIDGQSVYDEKAVQEITLSPGTSIDLSFSISGGNSNNYAYFMDRINGGNVEKITPYKEADARMPLKLEFNNEDTEAQIYRIVMFPLENPTTQIALTVNVAPAKIEEPPYTPPVTPSGEGEGEGSGSGSGSGSGEGSGSGTGGDTPTSGDTPSTGGDTPTSGDTPSTGGDTPTSGGDTPSAGEKDPGSGGTPSGESGSEDGVKKKEEEEEKQTGGGSESGSESGSKTEDNDEETGGSEGEESGADE